MNENDYQKYYNLLASINFNSRRFITKSGNKNFKQERFNKVISILKKCEEEFIEKQNFVGREDCPPGTTWDPITKTCS